MSENPSTYTVADYKFDRLVALGAGHVFTVPGNYCAEFLITAERRSREASDSSGRLTCIGASPTTSTRSRATMLTFYVRREGLRHDRDRA